MTHPPTSNEHFITHPHTSNEHFITHPPTHLTSNSTHSVQDTVKEESAADTEVKVVDQATITAEVLAVTQNMLAAIRLRDFDAYKYVLLRAVAVH